MFFFFKNIEISSLRNALVKQTKPNEFSSNNSSNLLSHCLAKNFNYNQQMSSQLIHSPLSKQNLEISNTENFDINAQIRNLLIAVSYNYVLKNIEKFIIKNFFIINYILFFLKDDFKETVAHSSSYPTNLCNTVNQIQQNAKKLININEKHENKTKNGLLTLRYSGMQPSTSYTSSLSSSIASTTVNSDAFASAASNLWAKSNSNLPMHSIANQLSSQSQSNNLLINNANSFQHSLPRTNNHSLNSIYKAASRFFNLKNVLLLLFYSYQKTIASPVAQQLVAELNELKKNEYSHLNSNYLINNNKTGSLPRSLYLKV